MRLILALSGYAIAGIAIAAWATGDIGLAAYTMTCAICIWIAVTIK